MAFIVPFIPALVAGAGAALSYSASVSSANQQEALAAVNAKNQLAGIRQQGEASALQGRINNQLALNDAAQAKANAEGIQAQAEGVAAQGRAASRTSREEAARFAASQRAAIAKNGVLDSTASPLALLTETAKEAQEQADVIQFETEEQRRSLFREADSHIAAAGKSKMSAIGHRIDAGAALVENINQRTQTKLNLYSQRAQAAGARSAATGQLVSSLSNSASGAWTSWRNAPRAVA